MKPNKPTETTVRDTARVVTIDRLSGINTARVVSYESVVHPLYHKRYTKTSRMLVDTTGHDIQVGDSVKIVETKPISRHKSWKVREIVKKAPEGITS